MKKYFKNKFIILENKIFNMSSKYNFLMKIITFLGGVTISLVIIVGLIVAYLISKDVISFRLALASVSIIVFNHVLKILFRKPRPDSEYAKKLHTYSFPSGHSVAATINYLNLAYLAVYYNVLPLIIAYFLASWLFLLVGLSRVYLKAHYLIDVVVGMILSIVGFIIVISL